VPSSEELYPLVHGWLQVLSAGRPLQPVAVRGLAHLVSALLVGQSLRPSTLMRALLSPVPVPARQRYKRLARAWARPWLSPAWLSPQLVVAVLALVPPDRQGLTHLALDSVRCGPWEVFTLGVLWHGRALVVGWAVLPYRWPTGQFGPTVCRLVEQVAAVWPADRPAHLVADRAFPARALFRRLAQVGWGWTIRLRATHWVRLAGQRHTVRSLLADSALLGWTTYAAAQFASGAQEPVGTLVVGRGLLVVPPHQRGPASVRVRSQRHRQRQAYLARKHPHQPPDAARQTDAWVVLFSTHADWRAASTSYGRRWAIEGSYRDAQGGWDGQHGWDLEPTLSRLPDPVSVERVVGLWAVGTLLQTWLGAQLRHPAADPVVQAIQREWTTTGRLSVWASGRLALTEPTGRLWPWLQHTLADGAHRLATATTSPAPAPLMLLAPPATRPRAA
jgi:hypothetical protein